MLAGNPIVRAGNQIEILPTDIAEDILILPHKRQGHGDTIGVKLRNSNMGSMAAPRAALRAGKTPPLPYTVGHPIRVW